MRKTDGNAVLRGVREQLGLTQKQVAEDVGLTEGYICNLESGRYLIGAEAAIKIWDKFRIDFSRLGYTADDLLRGEQRAA
jgi:DNA-binding XRE family transcriptional regulator